MPSWHAISFESHCLSVEMLGIASNTQSTETFFSIGFNFRLFVYHHLKKNLGPAVPTLKLYIKIGQ